MLQNLENFVKFQNFQLENLVDFEKCCKTHIFLQKSEPIQPKTSNILPKFCQPTLSDVGPGAAGYAPAQQTSYGAAPQVRPRHRTLDSFENAFFGNASFGNAFFETAFFENAFFENFAHFWRARSRLYQNEILQENMRSTAFFKLYKICILLHRCNLKIFAKSRFEKSAIFVNIQQNFCK